MVVMRKIVHVLDVRRLLAHSLPKTDCSNCQERRSVLLMHVNVWQQQNRNMMMMIVIVVMIPPVSISVALDNIASIYCRETTRPFGVFWVIHNAIYIHEPQHDG
jgi:hypothetical protein